MSKFDVIHGVEGFCLVLDDERIAGQKPWGGGEVVHEWETADNYAKVETCENTNVNGYGFYFECSECGCRVIVHNCAVRLDELPNYCPNCGAKVVGK